MYKLWKKERNFHIYDFCLNTFYSIDGKDKKKPKIIYYDYDFNITWEYIVDARAFISFYEDIFIVGNQTIKTTTIFEKYSNKELECLDTISITTKGFPYTKDAEKILFVKKNKASSYSRKNWVRKDFELESSLFYRCSLSNHHLFVPDFGGGVLYVYNNDLSRITWQRDFSEECKYIDTWDNKECKGNVQHIYPYGDDKIIVCCEHSFCFCLDINTGKEIWKNNFSSEMTFNGNIGFSYSNGGSIAKIDLKTGAILNKDGKYFNLQTLPEYNGLHISTNTHTMVYHQGLLWALVYSNGYSFVVAINPHDWHYEWIHRVETIGKIISIKFHQNRMYLHDTEGDLHVYEKNQKETLNSKTGLVGGKVV